MGGHYAGRMRVPRTFAFLDLSGFTNYTAAFGDDATSGTGTFDSVTNPTWAQHASNDTDAYWGLIYNDTQAGDPAVAFVERGVPVDRAAGPLTITWDASGIATLGAA